MANAVSSLTLPVKSPGVNSAGELSSPSGDFFVGPENRLLAHVSSELLEGKCPYNPLVLYGPTGVGKSHLARGLANHLSRRDPTANVLFQTGTDFVEAFVRSWQRSEGAEANASRSTASRSTAPIDPLEPVPDEPESEFRQQYLGLRWWVFDDLGQLAGKPASQQAMCHLLDELWARGGRFIATARQSPHGLADLSPALRARLSSGLALPISPPGCEARQAILQHLAGERGLELPAEACLTLAEGLPANARELAGALVFLELATRVERRAITPADVLAFVADSRQRPEIDLKRIAKVVAAQFALKGSELKGSSRRQTVVGARGLAIYLARELTSLSLEQIGKFFGGRDHSTVLHAARTIAERLENEPDLANTTVLLRRRLGVVENLSTDRTSSR